jgi:hypothetical protein
MSSLNYSGTSKTAEFLLSLLMPFTESERVYDVFFLKKLKIYPGD